MLRPHRSPLKDSSAVKPDPMDDLTAVYLKAVTQDVAKLEQMLAALTRDPQPWSTARAGMVSIVHDIKGQGTSFGYPLMTSVGDTLLTLLRMAGGGDPATLELASAHVQALRIVLAQDIKGDGGEQGAALASRLKDLVESHLGQSG